MKKILCIGFCLFVLCGTLFAKTSLEKAGLKGNVRIVKETVYSPKTAGGKIVKGEKLSAETRVYDEKGNEIEKSFYRADGSLKWKWTYRYDNNGNMIEENEYYSTGKLKAKIEYTLIFDEKGNLIKAQGYRANGILNNTLIYEYDKKGNVVSEADYRANGSLRWKSVYQYDIKDNIIEKSNLNADGTIKRKWNYKYNERGDLIEERILMAGGNLLVVTYEGFEYDQKGNWIFRIEYVDQPSFSADEVIEREIEY